MKDLIIGGAANYSWSELKYWVNSIKRCGFTGDIVIVATNITTETLEKLQSVGVTAFVYGEKDTTGTYRSTDQTAPHVQRFIYLWNFLDVLKEKYRYVIVTDTRDVVFQTNPSEYLSKHCINKQLIASSEGLAYKDEPWGNQNLYQTFGPFLHDKLKDSLIHNVGTIAGQFDYVKDLLLMIFQMSLNRPISVVDQAVYNFLINQKPYNDLLHYTTNRDSWAIQLGTTRSAIESGAGDIGIMAKQDPTVLKKYLEAYQDTQPIIDAHIVKTEQGVPYCIVHQYDRIDSLKPLVLQEYDDKSNGDNK